MASYKKYIRRNHKPFVSAVGDLNRSDSINQVKAETDKSGVTVCVKEEPFVSDEYDLQPVKPDIVGIDAIRSITAESSTDTSRYGCNYSTDVKVKTEELSFIKNEPGASNNNESIETTTIKIEDDGLLYCEHNYTKEQQGKSSSGNIERPFKEDEEAGPSTSCELKTEVDLDAVKMDEEGITGSESTEEDSESVKRDTTTSKTLQFICFVCSYTTHDVSDLNKHRTAIHGFKNKVYACNVCGYVATRLDLVKRHSNIHGRVATHMCKYCKESFRTRFKLEHHLLMRHPNSSDPLSYKILRCTRCPYKTNVRSNLFKHRLQHAKAENESTERKQNRFTCSECPYTADLIPNLESHLRIIHGLTNKIYVCNSCSYVTTRKDFLEKHSSSHGKSIPCHTCKYCNKTFKSKVSFEHLLRYHPDSGDIPSDKVIQCNRCLYKTTKRARFLRHMLIHSEDMRTIPEDRTVEEEKQFTCYLCMYTTKELLHLEKHRTDVHGFKSLIHACNVCSYVTNRADLLRKHLKMHGHVCKLCNESFGEKYFLTEHLFKHHQQFNALPPNKILECLRCPYKTTLRYRFNAHVLHTKHAETSNE